MRVLKQTTTGDIYPWTAQLAERPDMVEVTNQPVEQAPQRDLPSDEEPIKLQPETPTENSEIASAAEVEEDPVEVFRRQASKGKKSSE